jgi:hypothetical protein
VELDKHPNFMNLIESLRLYFYARLAQSLEKAIPMGNPARGAPAIVFLMHENSLCTY